MFRFALLLVFLCAALSLRATGVRSLATNVVECIGHFCVTGLVTSVGHHHNFILEPTNGKRQFLFAEKDLGLHAGDVIEVTGERILHDNGDINPVVRRFRVLGHKSVPGPEWTPLPELVKGDRAYHPVATEGTLVLARRDEIDPTALQLIIKDGRHVLNATLGTKTVTTDISRGMLGARLRLTGLLLRTTGARKNLAPYLDIQKLEVVTPAPTDIFAVPILDSWTHPPNEILRLGPRRFEGIVMATWGGNQLMIVDKDYHHVKATLSLEDELPAAGTPVVVAGYPDTDIYSLNLVFARCRPLVCASTPPAVTAPINTTLRELLTDKRGNRRINGYCHGQLLRLKGTILDIQPTLRLFSLNSDGFTIPVDFSSTPSILERLEVNSTVEAVVLGVVESDTWSENNILPQTRGIKLVLRSADDLQLIARPPFWTPLRLSIVIAALLVVLVLIVLLSRLVNRLATRRKVAERTRLAVELHDSLSQTLAGVTCQIAAGRDAVTDDPKTATDLLTAAERMLESSRTELKNCLFDLRNNTVDDPDFAHAIERTLSIFRDETALAVRFPVSRALMTDSTAHAVLCIIRELVANAVRHGKAAHVRVAGSVEDGTLLFSVSDDGSGFDPARHPGPREGHFGLTGIQERLSSLGGKMDIESTDGKTRISVSLHCS